MECVVPGPPGYDPMVDSNCFERQYAMMGMQCRGVMLVGHESNRSTFFSGLAAAAPPPSPCNNGCPSSTFAIVLRNGLVTGYTRVWSVLLRDELAAAMRERIQVI